VVSTKVDIERIGGLRIEKRETGRAETWLEYVTEVW
jgi:hypothetical protein